MKAKLTEAHMTEAKAIAQESVCVRVFADLRVFCYSLLRLLLLARPVIALDPKNVAATATLSKSNPFRNLKKARFTKRSPRRKRSPRARVDSAGGAF